MAFRGDGQIMRGEAGIEKTQQLREWHLNCHLGGCVNFLQNTLLVRLRDRNPWTAAGKL